MRAKFDDGEAEGPHGEDDKKITRRSWADRLKEFRQLYLLPRSPGGFVVQGTGARVMGKAQLKHQNNAKIPAV
jgi:hypothetical protein